MKTCIVNFQLGEYLDRLDEEAEAESAREAEFEAAFADVPDTVLDVVRHWLGMDPKFCAAIDEALDKIITERNEP